MDYPRAEDGQSLCWAGVHVFFMDVAEAARPCEEAGLGAWPEAAETAARLGFANGRPFILGDAGSYDHRLNAFFAACPTLGIRSAASQRAYAYDLVTFARFLAASGKTVWDADRHDIDRYFDHRCGETAPEPLSLRSWNRAVTALKAFFLWAREDGYVGEVPFRRKTAWILPARSGRRRPVEVLAGTVRAGQSPRRIRFLTRDQYVAFRSVGLLGRLPDGSEDPAWTGRNGARDAAFADLLVHSGARVAEAASLLVPELPPPTGETVTIRLAAPTTKGTKGREVVFATGVLRSVTDYVELERANVVQRTVGKPLPEDALLARRGAASPGRSRSTTTACGPRRRWPTCHRRCGAGWSRSTTAGDGWVRSGCGSTSGARSWEPMPGGACSSGPRPGAAATASTST